MHELIVDNFAGGGGASEGYEEAFNRPVDIAINHDPDAIAMHKANHPETKHYCESVWDVDPLEATQGRPVALAHFSPDCTYFSKARGGKPVEKNIRSLAWVVLKWAGKVHPRVIIVENVEEIQNWGPLIAKRDPKTGRVIRRVELEDLDTGNIYYKEVVAQWGETVPVSEQMLVPDKKRAGQTFSMWIEQLESLGYKVEYRELRACDYGAPTIRKRFFLVARCDGRPIVWPEATHGDPEQLEVRCGLLKPWRTAAEIIDWSIPCPSIFERKRPLAENTMRRIARGIQKFVIENPDPFIIKFQQNSTGQDLEHPLDTVMAGATRFGIVTPTIVQTGNANTGRGMEKDIEKPLGTIVSKNEFCLVAPTLIQYHSETSKNEVRGQQIDQPIMTVDTAPRYGMVTAFLSKYYAGGYTGAGSAADEPIHTITARDHNALVTSHLIKFKGTNIGQNVDTPVQTITAGGFHFGEVRALLIKYYGQGIGQKVSDPLDTVVSKDRFGLVTVHGIDYQIIDIGMRMLTPRELFRAQGFPDTYIIDRDADGNRYPKSKQVARCGNAVPPPFTKALGEANLPELIEKKIETEEKEA